MRCILETWLHLWCHSTQKVTSCTVWCTTGERETNKYFSREKDSRNYWKGSFNFSKTKDLEIKGKEQTSAVSGHQNIHHCWEGTHSESWARAEWRVPAGLGRWPFVGGRSYCYCTSALPSSASTAVAQFRVLCFLSTLFSANTFLVFLKKTIFWFLNRTCCVDLVIYFLWQ